MRRVIVFARAPELGCVKTRLAADLGAEAALEIYRELGRHTLAAVCAVRHASVVVQYTPADRRALVEAWLACDAGTITLRPQCDGDLGARMASAVGEAVREGADAVVVVGTDCPSLDADVIERAFRTLERGDVGFGPAADGGYYLVALRAPHAALFHDIPWSASDTLRRTLEAAAAARLRVSLLEERMDIDTADDWRRWQAMRDATDGGSSYPAAAPE